MNRRYLFIIHGLPMGGAERFLLMLINYFSELGTETHLILLSNDDDLQYGLNNQTKVYKVLKKSRFDLLVVQKLRNVIQKINPTTVLCINTYSYFLTKLAISSGAKYNIVLSPHTTKPFSFYNYLQNVVYYRFVSGSDKIIYLCNAQMNYLNKIYRIKHHQRYIIYNGINSEYFSPVTVSADEVLKLKKQLGIKYSDKVIVQVARLQPEKRHEDAVKALSIINAKYNDGIHLLIVGGGNQQRKTSLQSLVKQLDLKSNVHFLDNQKDVRLFYKSADLFTLTSKSETFSLAALEAMSFGLPVVLTDVGGAKEMVTNYKNGFLVPVNNSTALAHAWDKALSLHFDANTIRSSVIKNFSEFQMLLSYKSILSSVAETF